MQPVGVVEWLVVVQVVVVVVVVVIASSRCLFFSTISSSGPPTTDLRTSRALSLIIALRASDTFRLRSAMGRGEGLMMVREGARSGQGRSVGVGEILVQQSWM